MGLRVHADGAVEADHLTVQHAVVHNGLDEHAKLLRVAETRGERDLGGKLRAHLLGQAGEQRRVEEARGDGADADAEHGEVARHGERHSNDAALGGRVGRLADLAVERGNAGRVHEHAAEAVSKRGVLGHALGSKAVDVECAQEVNANYLLKVGERVCAALRVQRACGDTDSGAVDGNVDGLAEDLLGLLERGLDLMVFFCLFFKGGGV